MEPIRFRIRDFDLNGVWDGDNQILLVEEMTGELTASVRMMGFNVEVRGNIDAAMDNRLRFRIASVGKLPSWMNPLIFQIIKSFGGKLRDVLEFSGESISFDPNTLIADDNETRILIRPQSFDLSPQAEQSIRQRVIDWTANNAGKTAGEIAEMVMVIPDAVILMVRLAKDSRVPASLKWKIGLAVAYAISPVDLIPDVLLGPLGLVDDALAMAIMIVKLASEIPPDLIKENWPGNPEIINTILEAKTIEKLAGMLPEKVVRSIRRIFGEEKGEAAATRDN